MKSIFLFLVLTISISILTLSAINAQNHCDLQLKLVSPPDGAEIPYGDTVKLYLSIKNLGPDDFDSSFAALLITDQFTSRITFVDIPNGDSVIIYPYSTLSGMEDTNYHLVLCSHLEPLSGYVDNNPSNDSACMGVTLIAKNNTGISPTKPKGFHARLFPNPAQEKVSLLIYSISDQQLSINIYSVLGCRVFHKTIRANRGQQLCSLNIKNSPPGLYFVKMINVKGDFLIKRLVIH